MEGGTPGNWWGEGESDQPGDQGNADLFDHESSVIAYNKSPFAASLPWLSVAALTTLLIQGTALMAPGGLELCFMEGFNLLFVGALLFWLMNDATLGARISVDPANSRIWVGHRGFRTELEPELIIEYGSSDYVRIMTRTEPGREGGTATYRDICICQSGTPPKTISSTNGPLSKSRARRMGKSIARAAGLDLRK
jgi:hypothetical protein